MKHIKSTLIIFYALLIGQITFLLISIYFVKSGIVDINSELSGVLILALLFSLSPLLVAGPIVYRRMIKQSESNLSLEQKLVLYKQGTVIKLAIVESPSILSIIFFLITGNEITLFIAILIIFLFYFHKPSIEKFVSDFNLTTTEKELLEKSN